MLTTTGLLITSTQSAAAWDIQWGPAETALVAPVVAGMKTGAVRGAFPGVLARMEARCAGPQAVGCTAGVAAIAVLGVAAYKTSDWWLPWLEDKIGGDSGNTIGTSTPANNCPGGQYFGTPCDEVGVLSFVDQPNLIAGTSRVGLRFKVDIDYSKMSVNKPAEVGAISVAMAVDCVDNTTNSSSGYAWQGAGLYVQDGSRSGDTFTWPPQELTCQSWQHVGGVKVAPNIRNRGDGFFTLANVITWRADAPAPADPQTPSEVNCKRPDGTTYSVTRNEVAVSGNVALGSCELGDTMTGFTIGGVFTDLTPTDADKAKYPLCVDQACMYRVLVDGQVCKTGVVGCIYWSHLNRTEPHRVECQFGPYVVNVSNCYALERAYEVDPDGSRTRRSSPNTDGNPDTTAEPHRPPAPESIPVPTPVVRPNPTTSPSPTTSPQPTTTPTSSTTPTATSTPTVGTPIGDPVKPPVVGCKTPYNLGAVRPVTAAGVAALGPMFDFDLVYGFRPTDAISDDHPSGLAADFMIDEGRQQGDYLAAYAKDNAARYNIQYIIWQQRIWNVDRANEGWRLMPDRGSPTANHTDHVHITFKDVGVAASTAGSVCDSDPGDQGENCVGRDISWNPVSWVLVPTKCALTWAFVPGSSTFSTAQADIGDSLEDSSMGKWVNALPDFWDDISEATGADTGTALAPPAKSVSFIGPMVSDDGGGGTGGNTGTMPEQPTGPESCRGPALPTGFLGDKSSFWTSSEAILPTKLYPFSACNAPVSYAADVSWALSTLSISFYGGLRIVRVLGSGFGWIVPVPSAPREDGKE